MPKWLASWSDSADSETATFETQEEAQAFIDAWIEWRGDNANDGGWPEDMSGYVCRIVEEVDETRTNAPEGSDFDYYASYKRVPVED
jgi:hypothetical protein